MVRRRGMVERMMDRVAAVEMRVVQGHFAAAVLVGMEAGRIFVGQGRRGHGCEQGRAGGGDQ
jgi:hypothetical protein